MGTAVAQVSRPSRTRVLTEPITKVSWVYFLLTNKIR